MPTAADTNDDEAVKLLEPGALGVNPETDPATVSDEPVGRESPLSAPVVVIGSVLAIVVALVVFSRPGPSVTEEIGQTTVPTTAPTTSVPGEATTTTAVTSTPATQAVPVFDENVVDDIPGVISAFDGAGSLIVIDREAFRPEENRLELTLTDIAPASIVMFDGAPPLGFVQRLSFDGEEITVELNEDRFVNPTFRPADIAPDLSGRVLIMERGNNSTMVTLAPVRFDDADTDGVLRWELAGQPDVLGHWRDRLLVARADRVWLVDQNSEVEVVAEGRVLAYDGRHLARLLCDAPTECRLVVGPPDDPERRTVALPDELLLLDDESWTTSGAIAPDGSRIAFAVRRGGLSLPMVIDMETGESTDLADGMNHQSPLAWSPEGDWLAYIYTDDVMVWDLERDRSWRVPVNRELESLLWRDRAPTETG